MADVQVLEPRRVPLGGVRNLDVWRTLPSRERTLVGAWCFVDHYGPTPVVRPGRDGMDVAPHPHIGLQTVSWLFEGQIEHRDSGGVHAIVRPGEVNLMGAGHGICHSEVSTPDTTVLHGIQLWVVLPERDRHGARSFQHHVARAVALPGATARVFIGELPGVDASPIETATPLLGVELLLEPGAHVELQVDAAFEHAVLLDAGVLRLEGHELSHAELACVAPGRRTLTLDAGDEPVRAVLLGGVPFDEQIVMWWNFVARTHDEIVAARDAWQAEDAGRFGVVEGYQGPIRRIPAPPPPVARLRARNRRPTEGPADNVLGETPASPAF